MKSIETAPEQLFDVLPRIERIIEAMHKIPDMGRFDFKLRAAVAASWTAYANRLQRHVDAARELATIVGGVAPPAPSPGAEAARLAALPSMLKGNRA